jgi:hypothetical protein
MQKLTSKDELGESIISIEEDTDSRTYSIVSAANTLNPLSPLLYLSSQLLIITK